MQGFVELRLNPLIKALELGGKGTSGPPMPTVEGGNLT